MKDIVHITDDCLVRFHSCNSSNRCEGFNVPYCANCISFFCSLKPCFMVLAGGFKQWARYAVASHKNHQDHKIQVFFFLQISYLNNVLVIIKVCFMNISPKPWKNDLIWGIEIFVSSKWISFCEFCMKSQADATLNLHSVFHYLCCVVASNTYDLLLLCMAVLFTGVCVSLSVLLLPMMS